MPKEPREQRSEIDKRVDSIIHEACVSVFEQIDSLPEERSLPPSRSDLWVSIYQQDLCAMVRLKIMYVTLNVDIVLNREIIRVWLTIHKNPEAHGVPKR